MVTGLSAQAPLSLAALSEPSNAQRTNAEVSPPLKEASFSTRLSAIARRELNWLGVVMGVAEPLPLTAVATPSLSEVSFSERLSSIARREANWLGVVTGLSEPAPAPKLG